MFKLSYNQVSSMALECTRTGNFVGFASILKSFGESGNTVTSGNLTFFFGFTPEGFTFTQKQLNGDVDYSFKVPASEIKMLNLKESVLHATKRLMCGYNIDAFNLLSEKSQFLIALCIFYQGNCFTDFLSIDAFKKFACVERIIKNRKICVSL